MPSAREEESKLSRAQDALGEARQNYEGACKTIALMHAAAFGGEARGANRGVVEDVEDLYARCVKAEERLAHYESGSTGTVLIVPEIEPDTSLAQQAYELMISKLGFALFDAWDDLPDSARVSFKGRAIKLETFPPFEQCVAILLIGAKLPR